jgi:putative ABC transport system ATP-binding protein
MIMETLSDLNSEGMTIIQVTHNEKFAKYGKSIIRLEDGAIRNETANKLSVLKEY